MAWVVNAEPAEEKIISIDCKDKRNQTVSLEIKILKKMVLPMICNKKENLGNWSFKTLLMGKIG